MTRTITPAGRVKRWSALAVVCPLCNAGVGKKCTGKNDRVRAAVHRQRLQIVSNVPVFDPRSVKCPTCGSEPKLNCTGKSGAVRIANHSARVIACRQQKEST